MSELTLMSTLMQSHKNLRDLGEALIAATDEQTQAALFATYWQQFLLHETAEERVAYEILQGKHVANPQLADSNLNYVVDEHHYFERMVESIALLTPQDPQRQALLLELVSQMDSHMQHEEAFIFPRLAEQVSLEQQAVLVDIYLQTFKTDPS